MPPQDANQTTDPLMPPQPGSSPPAELESQETPVLNEAITNEHADVLADDPFQDGEGDASGDSEFGVESTAVDPEDDIAGINEEVLESDTSEGRGKTIEPPADMQ